MTFIDIGGIIAVLLGYIMVAVGFYIEAAHLDEGRATREPVFNSFAAMLWPALLLIRIGQFVANPNPQRRP